jgi:hypothetical protein
VSAGANSNSVEEAGAPAGGDGIAIATREILFE